MSLRSVLAPGSRLEITVLRRQMVAESATDLVTAVATGKASPWLLPWVPLMDGGGERDIIEKWLGAAERRVTNERDRADLGLLARVIAALAGCQPAWDHALRGWNMNLKTSPIFDEIRAEGKADGKAEGMRASVFRQGRQKFGKAATRKQQKALESITDHSQLEILVDRVLEVGSWADLLGES